MPKTMHVHLVLDSAGSDLEMVKTPLEEEGWVALNVTSSALAWILRPADNRGFRIAVTEPDMRAS